MTKKERIEAITSWLRLNKSYVSLDVLDFSAIYYDQKSSRCTLVQFYGENGYQYPMLEQLESWKVTRIYNSLKKDSMVTTNQQPLANK